MEEQTNKFLIPGAIVVAGAFVALAIYSGGRLPSATDNSAAAVTANAKPVTSADHMRGNASAKLTIIEYSDTECPFCKVFHDTMKQVTASYGGQVAWVYRHFPIAQLHSKAPKEAEATECVAELGGEQAFWSYLDSIFAITNSNDSLDPSELPRLAGAAGVDEKAFDSCLNSGKYTQKIQDSISEAVKAGARGTPYTVIVAKDGTQTVINGAEPYDMVKAKIDALLK